MNIKSQKILYIIVVLNILFILLYGINILKQKADPLMRDYELKLKEALAERQKIPLREINYGDKFQNHKIYTIDGKELNISDSEKKFKFINVGYMPVRDEYKVNIEFFNKLNEFKKQINGDEILYIVLIGNAEIKDSDIPLLKKIQEKYNIHIAAVTDSVIISLYNVKSMDCGGVMILLDRKNIVRFIGSSESEDILSVIINNEIAKK